MKYALCGNEEVKRCVGKDKDGNEVEYLPVVHAKWDYWISALSAICTNCGFKRHLNDNLSVANYCPNCGAKMDEQ
jgi:predicted RNA-binding Zn-ribbon protein involved in translation (DUF1610 family)